jgi:hypothetical protein
MRGCEKRVVKSLPHGCAVNATLEGELLDGAEGALCDKVIGDDGMAKIERAVQNQAETGQPWFVAVGFRKPHTCEYVSCTTHTCEYVSVYT